MKPGRLRIAAAVSLIWLTVPTFGTSAEEKWQTGLGLYFSSGKYGTDQTTDILYVPLSVRRLFRNGDVTLIIPYVSLTSDGAVTLLSGQPNRTGKTRKPSPITESGLGDIALRARYYVVDGLGLLPTVALFSRTKFPTADEDRGLGSGEFDQGFGTELSKAFGERWIGFVDLGYTFIGDPPGLDLNDQWAYDFGAGYYFTPTLLGTAFYEERRALVPGLANPRDLLFGLNWKMASNVRFTSALEVGLSSGAPNYGLTGELSFRF